MSSHSGTARDALDSGFDRLADLADPAIVIDDHYRILAANEAYLEETNSRRNAVGRYCYEVSHGFDRPCNECGETCPLVKSRASGHRERLLHIHQTVNGREFVDVEIEPLDSSRGARRFLETLRPVQIASAHPTATGLVGRSERFNELLQLVQRVAREEVPVLLLGESGTGKELIARAIHEGSRRSRQPFVPVECSGLTESLFESELFGHRKGAFTGAHYDKPGLVEAAHHGTLFLDEIGEIPPQLQVKLLRLLETQTIRNIGSTEEKYVNFRLVCATNCDLREMVQRGAFRADLYYRISTFPIELPPLRERREDIELLAYSLLKRSRDTRPLTLTPQALTCLSGYDFPGNIRELQNMLERARILASGDVLECRHFPGVCSPETCQPMTAEVQAAWHPGNDLGKVRSLEDVEREYLQHLLATFRGTRAELATALGMSVRTLSRKIQGLD